MKKSTVLYAVVCARPENGFDRIDEVENQLYVVNYGDQIGLPVVRHKGPDFVDPGKLMPKLSASHCLDFYAPSVLIQLIDLCTADRMVYAHLATARCKPTATRCAEAIKKKYVIHGVQLRPVPESPTSPTEADLRVWAKESLQVLGKLPLKISGILEYRKNAQALAASSKPTVGDFMGEWKKIATENLAPAVMPALPEGIDIQVPEGYVLTGMHPAGIEAQLNSDGTVTVELTLDYSGAGLLADNQTIVPAEIVEPILAEELKAKIQTLGISPALMGSDAAHSQPEDAT